MAGRAFSGSSRQGGTEVLRRRPLSGWRGCSFFMN